VALPGRAARASAILDNSGATHNHPPHAGGSLGSLGERAIADRCRIEDVDLRVRSQYREKWGLPADYPAVAPNYCAARSAMARQFAHSAVVTMSKYLCYDGQ
jgi:hypothetical protein